MSSSKKLLQAAAGNAGGAVIPSVENVFSNYLYDGFGTSTDKEIVNGINLANDGGMIWIKSRTSSQDNTVFDTERGVDGYIVTNTNDAQYTPSGDRGLQSYNTDGFTIPSTSYFGGFDQASSRFTTWTFKKHEKFFDVVTYTGTGSAQNISHNLGSVPGMIWVKDISGSGNSWTVYHRSAGNTGGLLLNDTNAFITSSTFFNNTTPTDSQFTVGTATNTNQSGRSFVAYLFAHNNGDGIFGPDEDQDIIKCGGFTGSGNTDKTISLGFEPQFILLKNADNGFNWSVWDTMRGIGTDVAYGGIWLIPNSAGGENSDSDPIMKVTQDGFIITGNQGFVNQSGNDFIYMAIRRGPMLVPDDVEKVFALDTFGGTSPNPPAFNSGFPVDYAIRYFTGTDSVYSQARLTSTTFLQTNSSTSETSSTLRKFDYADGYLDSSSVNSNSISPMWQRAPNYFDIVCYNGNGSNRSIDHNLGVVPEMMWVKERNGSSRWCVYHKDMNPTNPHNYIAYLNETFPPAANTSFWNAAPTSTTFSVGTSTATNENGIRHIALLFASLDGISKVGSYTGTAADGNNIDCGFSNGAQFVMIRNISGTADWYVFDTTRGIVSGNESRLTLNTTAAETTGDYIDPYPQGFSLTSDSSVNNGFDTFIYYAVAAP
jgi:hypothetical protein